MNNLNHFSIPLKGLKNGLHKFHFQVCDDFFTEFENEIINCGQFTVDLTFDKNFGVSTLQFQIAGYYPTTCDRCMGNIRLPIKGDHTLMLKFGDKEESTDEVLFIHPETSILNVAEIIYEYLILSIPMIKVYDCEEDDPPPCNYKVLEKLKENENLNKGPSIWDDLQELDFNNN